MTSDGTNVLECRLGLHLFSPMSQHVVRAVHHDSCKSEVNSTVFQELPANRVGWCYALLVRHRTRVISVY